METSLTIALEDYDEKFSNDLSNRSLSIDNKYFKIYEQEMIEFRFIFSYLHYRLNWLIDFMNKGLKGVSEIDTIYFHADLSREFLDLNDLILELIALVNPTKYKIEMSEKYKEFLEDTIPKIQRYGGTTIDLYQKFELINFKPIFKVTKDTKSYGKVMNIIFASNGLKPKIVLTDAIENKIEIVENADKCLIYDKEIINNNLTWADLDLWWKENETEKISVRLLNIYADKSIEKIFFLRYLLFCNNYDSLTFPALIPEVYLHYDPKTIKELSIQKKEKRLVHQRMDFLMLVNGNRLVIELDGKQHYSDEDGKASPEKYAEMISYDRKMKLLDYEVYRFGGFEFCQGNINDVMDSFFEQLIRKYAPHLLK